MPINFPELVGQVANIDTIEESVLFTLNAIEDELLNINDPLELLHFSEELKKYNVAIAGAVAANVILPK